MRTIILVTISLFIGGAAQAMTCDDFLSSLRKADVFNQYPGLKTRPQQGMPEGFFEFSGLRHVDAGLACESGQLSSFSAGMKDSSQESSKQWLGLLAGSIKALDENEDDPVRVAGDLMQEASEGAKKAAGEFPAGQSCRMIDAHVVNVSNAPNVVDFQLSPAEGDDCD